MRVSLFNKIAIIITLSIFFSVLVMSVMFFTLTENELVTSKINEYIAISELTSQHMANPMYNLDKDSLDTLIFNLREDQNVKEAYVLFKDGRVFTDGTTTNLLYGKYLPGSMFEKYRITQESTHVITDNIAHVSVPIQATDRIGTLLLEFPLNTDVLVQNMLTNMLIIGTVAVIAITLLTRIGTLYITKPLFQLKKDVKKISQGDFDHKIKVSGKDEVAELSLAFEEMRQKVQETTNNLSDLVSMKTREINSAYDKLKIKEQQIGRHLSELQKLDVEKDKFIAMLSHEMKTPLVPIQGYVDILLSGHFGELSDDQKKKLQLVKQSCNSLKRLINDLLDIQQITLNKLRINKSKTDLTKLLSESLDELDILFENKSCIVETDFPKEMICYCDGQRIKQVMVNLIKNALNHSEQNSRLTIVMKQINNNIGISVKDYGSGIESEYMDKIFEPFYQSDTSLTRKYGGSGLGLPICKGIIENHGGQIGVKSEGKDMGSEFYILLPCDEDPSKIISKLNKSE